MFTGQTGLYTDCDHCGKVLFIKGFVEGSVAWCRECAEVDKSLLHGLGITTSRATMNAIWWSDPSKVELVRGIPKLKDTLNSVEVSLKSDSVECKRKYYGIDCNCSESCIKAQVQTHCSNIFGYNGGDGS